MKRRFKRFFLSLFTVCVIGCLFSCSAMALNYSNDPPSYLGSSDYIWVELDTVQLGTGVAYFPRVYRDNFGLTVDNQIINVSSSTLSGYFHAGNGTVTQIRMSSLNGIDYRYITGMSGSSYEHLDYTVSETLNTNIPFYGNYTVFNYERSIITILLLILSFVIIAFSIRRIKGA